MPPRSRFIRFIHIQRLQRITIQRLRKRKAFIIKYYVTRRSTKATEELSHAVDSFLTISIQNDSINFKAYGSYLLYVFKVEKDKQEL